MEDLLSCHYHSARIQLLEPLLTGGRLPGTTSLSSLSLSDMFTVNIFSQFTAALKAWFDNWLALPVCSYFYLAQPITFQLIHAFWAVVRWVRAAGPSFVQRPDKASSSYPAVPAMSGVPECPDLNSIQPPVPTSPTVLTQPLHALKLQVLEQPDFRIEVFAVLDSAIARFEAASREIEAAQGVVWDNNTWNVAADHLRIKKMKIEKWCEIASAAMSKGQSKPTSAVNNSMVGRNGEATVGDGGEWPMDLDWLGSGEGQNLEQWQTNLFDGIMMSDDMGAFLDFSGGLDVDQSTTWE